MPDGGGEGVFDFLEKGDGLRVKFVDAPARLEVLAGNGIDQAGGDARATAVADICDVEGDAPAQKFPSKAGACKPLADDVPRQRGRCRFASQDGGVSVRGGGGARRCF